MVAAICAVLAHLWWSRGSSYGDIYVAMVVCAVMCYLRARHVGESDQDLSSRCHVFLHLIGSLANIVMYQGLPPNPNRINVYEAWRLVSRSGPDGPVHSLSKAIGAGNLLVSLFALVVLARAAFVGALRRAARMKGG